jgi:hypothetical protein
MTAHQMPGSWTDPVVLAFVIIPIMLASAFVWGVAVSWRRAGAAPGAVRRAAWIAVAGTAGWMLLADLAARSGVLRQWHWTPPPIAALVLAIFGLGMVVGWGTVGRRFARWLPLWALVGIQSFRLPLELAMHAMYERGVMPVQMSYTGRNFDILTGITALIVAPLVAAGLAGRRLVLVWNIGGFALLINVVAIAVLSVPRIAWFGEEHVNVWVTYPPFIWLPTVMVLAALAGHLVIFHALARTPHE